MQPALKTCLISGCPNVVPERRRCRKHGANPDACIRPGCSRTAVQDGTCGGCLTDSPRHCRLEGCASPRYKTRLCYKHHRESIRSECKHPRCAILVEGDYYGTHDVGIDFAAGDWFDWVAAERLFQGRLDNRKPTVPELAAVMRMAERRHVPYSEVADRLGLDERMWGIWRNQVYRLASELVTA